MHPFKFLFEELNREVWGMPQAETRRDSTYGTAKPRKQARSSRFIPRF